MVGLAIQHRVTAPGRRSGVFASVDDGKVTAWTGCANVAGVQAAGSDVDDGCVRWANVTRDDVGVCSA
jgi:hypothetical protein